MPNTSSDVSFLDSSEFNEDEFSEVGYFDVDDFMDSTGLGDLDDLDYFDDLEALINIAKADPHTFTKETNRYCQLILNHPELEASGLPGILQCYNRYNGTYMCCRLLSFFICTRVPFSYIDKIHLMPRLQMGSKTTLAA